VEVWGEERVFVEAVARRIERKSGLREALWAPTDHPEMIDRPENNKTII
jgi:hypothetical protein